MGINERMREVEVALGLEKDSNDDVHENKDCVNVMEHNVFGIHIRWKNSAFDKEYPHICIGWPLGDLSAIASMDELKKLYLAKWPNHSNRKVGAEISQIWLFINEAKIDDYVVFFDRNVAHVGQIIGNYEYIENVPNQREDYVNNRKVSWLKTISYADLPSEYRRSSYARKSFYRLNSYQEFLQEILDIEDTDNDEYEEEDYSYEDNFSDEFFDFSSSPIKDGQNLIVYGTPGCGKSYYVEHTLLKDYDKENCMIRTTFFQDYTNTDFVGQILPVVDGDKVTYKFNPGPFTLALEKAIKNPNERVALVIEELNRGSAASIFGDIFQLLDRKDGVSEYPITNVNIIDYLNEKFKEDYKFKEIKIPGNLSIFATMNTSDQNVFVLDNAFKRRWKFKKLANQFNYEHEFKNKYIPSHSGQSEYTWEEIVTAINDYVLEVSNGLNSEDKQIGIYFVDGHVMRDNKDTSSADKDIEDFAYKFFEYLWDDVAKFQRRDWFKDDIKSLDDIVKTYKDKGIDGVFIDAVLDKKK